MLLKITPSSTGHTYSVASDNFLRLYPHTDDLAPAKELYRIGLTFTHEKGVFGAVSFTEPRRADLEK